MGQPSVASHEVRCVAPAHVVDTDRTQDGQPGFGTAEARCYAFGAAICWMPGWCGSSRGPLVSRTANRCWLDGRVLDVASVVWCTGFRPDYSWIHLPVVDADGWPRQERGVAASAPGLFFLGIPFLYGFTSMLVIGAGRDAAFIVDRIAAARMQASPKPAPGLA